MASKAAWLNDLRGETKFRIGTRLRDSPAVPCCAVVRVRSRLVERHAGSWRQPRRLGPARGPPIPAGNRSGDSEAAESVHFIAAQPKHRSNGGQADSASVAGPNVQRVIKQNAAGLRAPFNRKVSVKRQDRGAARSDSTALESSVLLVAQIPDRAKELNRLGCPCIPRALSRRGR